VIIVDFVIKYLECVRYIYKLASFVIHSWSTLQLLSTQGAVMVMIVW